MAKLANMWQRRSAKGTIYFSGFMGDGQVLLFREGCKAHPTRPDEQVTVWKLLVQERHPDRRPSSNEPAQPPAERPSIPAPDSDAPLPDDIADFGRDLDQSGLDR